MVKLDLRTRLFLSYLIVMGVGILTLVGVARLYTPRLFVVSLERIEGRGIRVQHVRTQLVKDFTFAWSQGMFWSILAGGGTAGVISYWLSQRIVRPLVDMENITRRFAIGQLEERLPDQDMPELHRLATSFNRMADGLENVEQRRRELVGDLTHELRTPLTIIGGYLEGLADGTIDPSAGTYLRLVGETNRLKRLVNDLQELSRLEAGYLPIQPRFMALYPLLQRLVQRFADQLMEDSPVVLELDPKTTDLPEVFADPERVEQILVNLLSNGLRYTEAGVVGVTGWSEPEQVWIAVRDTGIGIAEEDLPHVFERFWRADRSRDRTSGGTGVGLAICKRLVELQGGTIEVDSVPGKGSEFRFSLPKRAI